MFLDVMVRGYNVICVMFLLKMFNLNRIMGNYLIN